jgi:hypothetical protein
MWGRDCLLVSPGMSANLSCCFLLQHPFYPR